uniref:Secreted protein n=1 Tax=Cacopsylla melanoneura TaxID=428564 RepID=A0A8D8R5A1_9HEMI
MLTGATYFVQFFLLFFPDHHACVTSTHALGVLLRRTSTYPSYLQFEINKIIYQSNLVSCQYQYDKDTSMAVNTSLVWTTCCEQHTLTSKQIPNTATRLI